MKYSFPSGYIPLCRLRDVIKDQIKVPVIMIDIIIRIFFITINRIPNPIIINQPIKEKPTTRTILVIILSVKFSFIQKNIVHPTNKKPHECGA